MRKRGTNLNSPEANFMFGGADNEQVFDLMDGQKAPYDARTAAVDSIFEQSEEVTGATILGRRDEIAEEIERKIPDTKRIEQERKKVADALSQRDDEQSVDQQG
jgi:HEAT repeat protein